MKHLLLGPIYQLQRKRSIVNLTQGLQSQKLIFFVTYEWAQKARVFVPEKPLQPNLMKHLLIGPIHQLQKVL
jgi:hypothetical protein